MEKGECQVTKGQALFVNYLIVRVVSTLVSYAFSFNEGLQVVGHNLLNAKRNFEINKQSGDGRNFKDEAKKTHQSSNLQQVHQLLTLTLVLLTLKLYGKIAVNWFLSSSIRCWTKQDVKTEG